MTQLEQFITENRTEMLACLTTLVKQLQDDIKHNPDWYLESGTDTPSIDIRLCIDVTRSGMHTWTFRTGLVDYDTSHSEYCAASCVDLETDASELLNDLIEQLYN